MQKTEGLELQLVGAKTLAIYNGHRCYLKLGLPRSIPERLSIHPPFIKRNVGSESDQVLVRAAIAMLMGSGRLRQPKTVPVERPADVNNYLEWIRTIRPKFQSEKLKLEIE